MYPSTYPEPSCAGGYMYPSTYPEPSCAGGNYLAAFGAVAKAGGITTNSSYLYDITAGKCDTTKNDYVVTVTGYHRVEGQQNMINHVLNGGTLVVAVDASAMGQYKSGYSRAGQLLTPIMPFKLLA